MARTDGVDRTFARNRNLKEADIGRAQRHNERENEAYSNVDIITERSDYNVHFKEPSADYAEMFAQMLEEGTISTRGLKKDAYHYGELVFDVNSAYFHNHGGYEFAKKFYEDAYRAAIDIVGGEQYILSAVMHADERNRAMSEALGQEVYHYHMHVVYVPVVEKEILWSKRCKEEALRGTIKEVIQQVSQSKKWASEVLVDEKGEPVLNNKGKKTYRKSYSVLQDKFYEAMRDAGYTDVERGERGSTEEHLTVAQFKVAKEQERLQQLEAEVAKRGLYSQKLNRKISGQEKLYLMQEEIEKMGLQSLFGKIELTQSEAVRLKKLAKEGIAVRMENMKLRRELKNARQDAKVWKTRYEQLWEQTKEFVAVMKMAPEKVKGFVVGMLKEIDYRGVEAYKSERHGR